MPIPISDAEFSPIPADRDAHLRQVSRRRWWVQRRNERRTQRRRQLASWRERIRERRQRASQGRSRSIVPAHSLLNEWFLRGRR